MAADRMQDHLAYLIASLNRRLEDEFEEQARSEGLSIEQMRILDTLASGESLPMGKLAHIALVDGPTLTKIIDRMVAGSLVFRSTDPHDRRRVVICLANQGKIVQRRAAKIARAQQARLVNRLDASTKDQLQTLLRGLADE